MKQFLRENPTISFGLGLPLVIVVVFLLISGIPSLFVAPPQYDLLYATNYNDYPYGVQISVVENKVQVSYQGSVLHNQKPRIWRYNARTGALKEIALVLPPGLVSPGDRSAVADDASKITPIKIPGLQGLTVDSSSIAPDGYEFITSNERYSRNVFGGLFYPSRHRHEGLLIKNGRSIRLRNAIGYTYWGNTHFIGWVVSS